MRHNPPAGRMDEGRPGGDALVDAPYSCWIRRRRSGKDQTKVREVMVAELSDNGTRHALPIIE